MAEDFNNKVKAALDVCAPWKYIKICSNYKSGVSDKTIWINLRKRWPSKVNSQITKKEKKYPWKLQKPMQPSYKSNRKRHSKSQWRKIKKARDEKEIWKVVNQILNQ